MCMRVKGLNPENCVCVLRLRRSSYKIAVIMSLLLSLFAGCNNPKNTTGAPVVSSQDRKAELLKMLERRPENPKAQYELGKIFQSEGRYSDAEWRYNQALTFDPVFRQAQASMVNLFVDSRNSTKEKHYAEIYMQQVSANADQALELAMAFQEVQLDRYALACYQKALELAPNSAKVHKQMGYYYLNKGDKQKAADHFVQSYNAYPNQPDVARELGLLDIKVVSPQETKKP
jgi:Flp pilus assembly protein TadD